MPVWKEKKIESSPALLEQDAGKEKKMLASVPLKVYFYSF